jgi:hypothetical protein
MFQRNDVVQVKATGEKGLVIAAGSELQIIVEFSGDGNARRRFSHGELEMVRKGEGTL